MEHILNKFHTIKNRAEKFSIDNMSVTLTKRLAVGNFENFQTFDPERVSHFILRFRTPSILLMISIPYSHSFPLNIWHFMLEQLTNAYIVIWLDKT
jgi:hypothetical protein